MFIQDFWICFGLVTDAQPNSHLADLIDSQLADFCVGCISPTLQSPTTIIVLLLPPSHNHNQIGQKVYFDCKKCLY